MASIDLEYWMTYLPESLSCQPLTLLAIPGSHNSASYAITETSALSPDAAIYDVLKRMGAVAPKLLSKWTRTQDGNLTEQLLVGTRYFDLRVLSTNTSTSSNMFFFVHGQVAHEVTIELFNIRSFLKDHPKEVVFLDFNHFYQFNSFSLQKLEELIIRIFGDMLTPRLPQPPSLNQLWAAGNQVICFFQSQDSDFAPSNALWTNEHITAPWPKTNDLVILFAFLDNHPAPGNEFHVSQCVFTPDAKCILSHLDGDLKSITEPLGHKTISWLEQKKIDYVKKRVNIVMTDFVVRMLPEISRAVISLNLMD